MKLKIANKKKVVRNIIVLNMVILGIIFFNTISLSHTEVSYKTIYTTQGDTLWSIAKEEQSKNEYYQDKDVRDIIEQIKQVNGLKNTSLSNNQKLEIPTI